MYELFGLSSGRPSAYSERVKYLEMLAEKAGSPEIPEIFMPEGESARCFLRGCFLGCGTVNSPEFAAHLEFRFRSAEMCRLCRETLVMEGFLFKLSFRREYAVIYTKTADTISELLTYLGAYKAVLDMENARVTKEVTSGVNRVMNCDIANSIKANDAGRRQAEMITALQSAGRFNSLPESVRQIAMQRLEDPDASLTELGKRMEPPISKSGAAHRMKVIEDAYKLMVK